MGLLDPLPPQDAFYGISRDFIATRLTTDNWTDRAVVRTHAAGWLYIWIRRLTHKAAPGEVDEIFQVRVTGAGDYARGYDEPFLKLAQALAYANGTDGGRLARESTPATPDEYPDDRPAISFAVTSRRD